MEGDVIELILKLKWGSVHLVEICFGVNWRAKPSEGERTKVERLEWC